MRASLQRPEVAWPLAVALLYAALCVAGGQVFRPPFDDEVFTLRVLVEQPSLGGVFRFFSMGGDVHPPAPTMLQWVLWHAGLGEYGLRLVSLAMSALALALAHNLVLKLAPRRLTAEVQVLLALLMATVPVFLGQGDAVRWYPLFALVFMLAVRAMVVEGRLVLTPWGGLLAGVWFSVNFLGAGVGVALVGAVAWQDGWRAALRALPRFGVPAALGAASGVPALVSSLMLAHHAATQFEGVSGIFGHLRPVLEIGLGLLGGYRLGIGASWLLVPGLAASGWAVWRLRRHPLVWLLVANGLVLVPLVALGFNKPRALMYVALTLAMVNALAAAQAPAAVRRWLVAGLLVSQLAVVAGLQPVGSGFKRNLAIPYPALVASVKRALADGGPTAVLTTDPTLAWMLTRPGAGLAAGDCVSFYRENAACVAQAAAGTGRLVTVAGQGAPADEMAAIDAATAGREKRGSAVFGYDGEAGLKSRLTGVALAPEILVMAVWERK